MYVGPRLLINKIVAIVVVVVVDDYDDGQTFTNDKKFAISYSSPFLFRVFV